MKFFAAVSPLVLLAAGQGALAAGNGGAARNGQGNANRANANANAAAAVAAGGRPQDNPNGTTRTNYPIPQAPDASANGQINTQAVDAGTLQRASTQWMTDTGIVSGFLNDGPTITDDQTFKSRAKRAYDAEVNELTQKAILERAILNDPAVSVANLTLTNGSFQNVVDNLLAMSVKGPSSASLIDVINVVRCPQVLPSIDTYMAATNQAVGGDLNSAVRPQACATVTRAPVDTYGIAGVNNPVAGLQINNLQTGQVAGANGINGAVPSAGAVGNAGQANANADGNGRNANGGRGNAGAGSAGGNVNALGNRAGAGNLIAGANQRGGSNLGKTSNQIAPTANMAIPRSLPDDQIDPSQPAFDYTGAYGSQFQSPNFAGPSNFGGQPAFQGPVPPPPVANTPNFPTNANPLPPSANSQMRGTPSSGGGIFGAFSNAINLLNPFN